jgi:hypothetical protein
MKTKLILTLLYLCSLSLFAEVNFNNEKILWQLPEKKIIPSSLKPSTTVFDIKDVVIPNGYQAILMFDARILSSAIGGWNPYMELKINNKILTQLTSDGRYRLIGRTNKIKTSHHRTKEISIYNKFGKSFSLLTFFAPENAKTVDNRILTNREANFQYCFNITDLLNAKNNKIQFQYLFTNNLAGNRQHNLLIKYMKLSLVPENELTKFGGQVVFKQQIPLKGKTIWTAPNKVIKLVTKETPVATTINFPALKVSNNHVAILVFDARILSSANGGWNPYLGITINNNIVGRLTKNHQSRLLCRNEVLKTTYAREKQLSMWNPRGKTIRLLNFFAPEKDKEFDQRIITDRSEGFRYCLNINDLTNIVKIGADDRIENNKPNKMTLTFYLRTIDTDGKKYTMVIKDLRIVEVPQSDLRRLGGIKTVTYQPGKLKKKINLTSATLGVTENGALEIHKNGDVFFIESKFSYPATPVMQYNHWNVNNSLGEKPWKVTLKANNKNSISIISSGNLYSITRTIEAKSDYFNITDKIVNTSKKEIGLKIENKFSSYKGNYTLNRIAGATGIPSAVWHGAVNPTAFIAGEKSSIGLVATDTVSRAQMVLNSLGNVISMGTNGVGIAPGKTLIRTWAIYPTQDTNYFTFINNLRKQWKVNKTIPGPFWNSSKIPQGLDPEVVFAGTWLNYTNSHLNPLDPQVNLARIQKDIKRLPATKKNRKVLGLLETNLIAFDCSKVPWGNELVQRTGSRYAKDIQYGQYMSLSTTAKIDAATPYKDAIIRDAKGRAMYDNYYPKKPFINLMVQLEENNSRHKLFIQQRKFLLETAKVQGAYIDQFQPAPIGGTRDDKYDNYTVVLSPNGEIQSKKYSYIITGAKARAAVVKDITQAGGMVLINGQAISMEEQNDGRIAFQEMENDRSDVNEFLTSKPPMSVYHTICHLGTPILLGLRAYRYQKKNAPDQRAQIIFKGIIWGLRNGLLTYYYNDDAGNMPTSGPNAGSYEIANKMYPFTPEELQEGWIKGKERTITTISGTFSVKGKNKPKLYLFDNKGFIKPNKFTISGKPDNWNVDIKLNNWNEIAIIEVQ